MSGGSYNYAYSKIDELRGWCATLGGMAAECRGWAADPDCTRYVGGKDVPLTLEDRAAILVRGLLLERAAERLRVAVAEVSALSEVMHDVEWIASGDYGIDRLTGKWRERDDRP